MSFQSANIYGASSSGGEARNVVSSRSLASIIELEREWETIERFDDLSDWRLSNTVKGPDLSYSLNSGGYLRATASANPTEATDGFAIYRPDLLLPMGSDVRILAADYSDRPSSGAQFVRVRYIDPFDYGRRAQIEIQSADWETRRAGIDSADDNGNRDIDDVDVGSGFSKSTKYWIELQTASVPGDNRTIYAGVARESDETYLDSYWGYVMPVGPGFFYPEIQFQYWNDPDTDYDFRVYELQVRAP